MKKQPNTGEISFKIAKKLQKVLTNPIKSAIINADVNKSKGGKAVLLQFTCSNHKSIRKKILFSMLASSDDEHPENLTKIEKHDVLRSAVIYGANGSGKSNTIDAIAFMKDLVTNGMRNQPNDKIRHSPHKLATSNEESEYTMQFITQGVRYSYGFTLLNGEVTSEYLKYVPSTRMAKIFTRQGNEIIEGDSFKGRFANGREALKSNRLFLSCVANFCDIEEVARAFNFYDKELVIYNRNGNQRDLYRALDTMANNPKYVAAVSAVLRAIGMPVRDICVKIEKVPMSGDMLNTVVKNMVTKGSSINFANGEIGIYDVKMMYKNFVVDLFEEESTGTKKIIAFMCSMLDAMAQNKILICDELDANLHESVLIYLVKLFHRTAVRDKSQIIFTTHNTSVLDLEYFRRDQIWFTEQRDEDRSTDLYSLIEINNVRKDENTRRGYIGGKYGAIPMLNEKFADCICDIVKEVED